MKAPFLLAAVAFLLPCLWPGQAQAQGCYGGSPPMYAGGYSSPPPSYGGYSAPFGGGRQRVLLQVQDPYSGRVSYRYIDVDLGDFDRPRPYAGYGMPYANGHEYGRPREYAPVPRFHERTGGMTVGGYCPTCP